MPKKPRPKFTNTRQDVREWCKKMGYILKTSKGEFNLTKVVKETLPPMSREQILEFIKNNPPPKKK